jgi:proline iminopeptidase
VAIASNRKLMNFPLGPDYNGASEYPTSLFVGEYTLLEQLRGMAAIAETFNVLYPQLSGTDFRSDVPALGVPVYINEGQHEAAGRETLAREWYGLLAGLSKNYIKFADSGHTPPFDEPGHLAKLMSDIHSATKVP